MTDPDSVKRADEAWERIKDKFPITNPEAPYNTVAAYSPNKDPFTVNISPPEKTTNLDPALERLKESRSPSSGFTPETLKQAMDDQKAVRQEALDNAKQALEKAFAPRFNQMLSNTLKEEEMKNIVPQKPTEPRPDVGDITEAEIDEVIKELEDDNFDKSSSEPFAPIAEKKKTLEETKKMIETFRDKLVNYPKHLSYEGSMVLCVLLSMKETARSNVSNLPVIDYQTIRSVLPDKFSLDTFTVTFDENKDFVLHFVFNNKEASTFDTYNINMINSVAHPRPEDLQDLGSGTVPVKKDGDRISVGGTVVIDKQKIKKLIGVEPLKRSTGYVQAEQEQDANPKRQPVAGRNAFELRTDILTLAAEWVRNVGDEKTEDEVMRIAKLFYSFVENRR